MAGWQMGDQESRRVRPLTDVPAIYERFGSVYPEAILVPMEDGRTIEYRILAQQPGPVIRDTDEPETIGYRKTEGRRSRSVRP